LRNYVKVYRTTVLYLGFNYEVIATTADDFNAYLAYVTNLKPGVVAPVETLWFVLDHRTIGGLMACYTSLQNRLTGQILPSPGVFEIESPRDWSKTRMRAERLRIAEAFKAWRLQANP
jgi:hypothetical protein